MDFLSLVVTIVLYPVRFLLGWLNIWIVDKRVKGLAAILKEHDASYIVSRGTISVLNFIAAVGAISAFVFVVAVIIGIFKNGPSYA